MILNISTFYIHSSKLIGINRPFFKVVQKLIRIKATELIEKNVEIIRLFVLNDVKQMRFFSSPYNLETQGRLSLSAMRTARFSIEAKDPVEEVVAHKHF